MFDPCSPFLKVSDIFLYCRERNTIILRFNTSLESHCPEAFTIGRALFLSEGKTEQTRISFSSKCIAASSDALVAFFATNKAGAQDDVRGGGWRKLLP